jgi:sugar phosphate isomerase/epimerase
LNLNWDPNNAAEKGEHPFPEGYKLLDPARIIHVHLRDFKHNAAGVKTEQPALGRVRQRGLADVAATRLPLGRGLR